MRDFLHRQKVQEGRTKTFRAQSPKRIIKDIWNGLLLTNPLEMGIEEDIILIGT